MSRSSVLLLCFVIVGLATGVLMSVNSVDWYAWRPSFLSPRATTGLPPADFAGKRTRATRPSSGAASTPAKPAAGAAARSSAPGAAAGATGAADAGAESAPAEASAAGSPGPRDEPTIRIVAESTPDPVRRTIFVAGNSASWTRFDIEVTSPLNVQAGGQVGLSGIAAGPAGIVGRVTPAAEVANDFVLASAPYLALIGRICSPAECSSPFLIGERSVICPAALGIEGTLELWTNNRARVGTAQTRTYYSSATGGFHVYVDRAGDSACSGPVARSSGNDDGSKLAAGLRLDRPEFVVTSSQSNWKPFFVPLDRPIRISAYGDVRPGMNALPTGPGGVVVPPGIRWIYPGASQVIVDEEHVLFAPSLPYQALIGRVCGSTSCGPVFLVGAERVVCAPEAYRDRLELWINHILPPPSLMGQSLPTSMQAFTLQSRTGAYQFSIVAAPEQACGA